MTVLLGLGEFWARIGGIVPITRLAITCAIAIETTSISANILKIKELYWRIRIDPIDLNRPTIDQFSKSGLIGTGRRPGESHAESVYGKSRLSIYNQCLI